MFFKCWLSGGVTVLLLVYATASSAQKRVSETRADGHVTPMLVYDSVGAKRECAPLAVISHGAGGSENRYRYLAEAMSKMGYTAVVIGHRESGPGALSSYVLPHGVRKGLEEMVVNRDAESARLLDVGQP